MSSLIPIATVKLNAGVTYGGKPVIGAYLCRVVSHPEEPKEGADQICLDCPHGMAAHPDGDDCIATITDENGERSCGCRRFEPPWLWEQI